MKMPSKNRPMSFCTSKMNALIWLVTVISCAMPDTPGIGSMFSME